MPNDELLLLYQIQENMKRTIGLEERVDRLATALLAATDALDRATGILEIHMDMIVKLQNDAKWGKQI